MAQLTELQAAQERIKKAYKAVYSEFYIGVQQVGAIAKPRLNGECFNVGLATGQVNSIEVRGALRIDNLPYKRKNVAPESPRGNSGIFVLLDSLDMYKFRERPAADTSFLWGSNVRLAYYARKGQKWAPILDVRYDFAKAFDAHPIFHAQLGSGALDHEERRRFDAAEIENVMDTHQTVRLPTANVIGATALLSLAADHLPLERFAPMLNKVRGQQFFQNWRCDCSSLDRPLPEGEMLATGWYSAAVGI